MSLKALTLTFIGSLAFAACASTMQRPPAEPVSEIVEVVIKDDAIDLSPAHVAAGRIGLDVANHGLLEHVLRVEGQGLAEPADTDLASGQQRQVSIRLKPGVYRVFCPDADHADRGLRAELTVDETSVSFHR
jgi:hypothetical protein